MIHTHTSPLGFSSPLPHERRLCRIEPQEALRAPQQIRENPALDAALRLYDDPFLRNEYPELQNSNDRANFRALLLANIVRPGTAVNAALTNHNRATFLPVDPSRIFPEGTVNPTNVQLHEAGQRLKLILTDAQLLQLHRDGRRASDRALGESYFDARSRALDRWNQNENLHDRPFQLNDAPFQAMIRTPIELYRYSRGALDRILNDHEILFPGIESADSPGVRLSRREYAGLLALVWNGGTGQEQIRKAAATAGTLQQRIEALRKLTADPACRRVQEAFDLIVHEEHGPTELLRTLDITLGPGITIAYVNRRRGQQPRILPPGRPGPNTVRSPALERNVPEGQVFQTMDSAATWRGRANAGRSIAFLLQNLPDTPKNQEFLRSLRFHFGTPQERAGVAAAPLTEEATLLRLHLIIDTLVLHEEVTTHSTAQTERLRERVGLSQRANEFVGSMVDIVRDWRNNPVPAALVVAGGFLALRQAYRFLTGEHRGITRWMTYIGLGAVAYGLYQERQQGSAWWDSYAEQIGDWWRGQEALPPERRTLPNLWAREIQMDNATTVRCLSLLQNQSVPTVCGFYEDMRRWESSGARAEQQPQVPKTLELGRYGQMFGQMTNQEIGRALYQTLKAFFRNRGAALGAQGFQYAGQHSGEEERGFHYIRERYEGRRFFSRIVEGTIRVEGAEVDGRLMATWDTRDTQARLLQLRRQNPAAHRAVIALRAAYVEEQRTAREQVTPWMWQTVLLFEADPGALERMGREGAQPAGFLRRLERWYNDVLHQYSPLEPGPEDRADAGVQLMPAGSAEHTLLTQNSHLGGGRFGQLDRPPVTMTVPILGVSGPLVPITAPGGPEQKLFRETLQKEWAAFLDRIPISQEARQSLAKYMENRISTWPANQTPALLDDIEEFRYRLLAAAVTNRDRLSEQIARNPPAIGATNIPDWMRFLTPFESERFPEINSLADVQSLFDVNVFQNGGTAGFAVWMRMFPRWQASDFPRMAEQIQSLRDDMAQFRQLPQLALPGVSGSTGATAVENLDRFVARRIASRLVELSLYTLRSSGSQIPDTQENRFVTPNEQASLRQYITTLSGSMLSPRARERLQEFNKRANEVENHWPAGRLRIIVAGGEVQIAMHTGGAVPERFLTTTARDSLTEEQARFRMVMAPMTPDQFLTRTAQQIVEQWQKQVLADRLTEINALTVTVPRVFTARIDGTDVLWKIAAHPEGRTPAQTFFMTEPGILQTKYDQWIKRGRPTPNPLDA